MAGCNDFRFAPWLVLLILTACSKVSSDLTNIRCAGWSVTPNYCFRFSNVKVSWNQAIEECKKLDSTLVRLYDASTKSALISAANVTMDTRWWTDLNDIPVSGIWVWGQDGNTVSASQQIVQWNSEPDDSSHLENCIALNIQGAVSDQRCADRHSYICEYSLPQGSAGCQDGWLSFENSCYNFVGVNDPWNLASWNTANASCSTLADPALNPHLLFLETAKETAYVRHQLPVVQLTSQLWWIGMTDLKQEGVYLWTDGTRAQTDKLVWDVEPNNLGGGEQCGVIFRNGRFGDLNCSRAENYVCMKDNDNGQPVLNNLGCPNRWIRAGRSCYLLEAVQMRTWSDAAADCRRQGSHLIQVDSQDEKSWLEYQTTFASKAFWTGLNDLRTFKLWRWPDESVADTKLIRWNQEPNNYKGIESCAAISQDGTFNDVECTRVIGFICEMSAENSGCPAGWTIKSFQSTYSCYYISNSTGNNDEAHAQCHHLSFPRESYLVAFNSKDELAYITNQLSGLPATAMSWYTGLTDRASEGFWTYDTNFNRAPPDGFIPWEGMPRYVTGDEHCAYVTFGGRYKNKKCSTRLNYMCEKPAGTSASSAGSLQSLRNYVGVFFLCACLSLCRMFVSQT